VLAIAASNGCASSKSPEDSPQEPRDNHDGAGEDLVDAGAPVGMLPGAEPPLSRDVAARLRVAPIGAAYHLIGRLDLRDPAGPRFGWPGTQLRVRFAGTGLALELADTGASHYDVAVDGWPLWQLVVSGGRKTYDVASGLAAHEQHDVVLTKRTETVAGVTQLLGVVPQAGGALVPTPAPSGRRIELVGDSIACGFGVLGADETCPFTAATESEPLAWGALAARRLAAIHPTTAVSGIGLFRNYGGGTVGTMPEVYGRSVASDPSSTWDHSFVPDVIVVSLGTNDYGDNLGDPGPAFADTYVAFLATLRATHPHAQIVATTSPMLAGAQRATLHAYLETAIAARLAAGESRLTLLDLDEQDFSDGLGCQYHPSKITQQKMASKLVAHLESLMGW
jgi:lysophospholipase L1-like esterase